jgi:hypothetical protein
MNIFNFMQRFPDEASCIACLKEQREQSGVVCKRCGLSGTHLESEETFF